MATVTISLVSFEGHAARGDLIGIRRSVPVDVATPITSSGTSQQADITGPARFEGLAWEIVAETGAVWVKAGSSPTATVGGDSKILAGERIYMSVAGASEKLAVIDHS